jgi:hypothetical protein
MDLRDGREVSLATGVRPVPVPAIAAPRSGVRDRMPGGAVSPQKCGFQSPSGGGTRAAPWPVRAAAAIPGVYAGGGRALCPDRQTSAKSRPSRRSTRCAVRPSSSPSSDASIPATADGSAMRRPVGRWRGPAGAPGRRVCEGSPPAAPDRRQRSATTTAIAAAETPAATNPARGMVRGCARFAIAPTRRAAMPAAIVRP